MQPSVTCLWLSLVVILGILAPHSRAETFELELVKVKELYKRPLIQESNLMWNPRPQKVISSEIMTPGLGSASSFKSLVAEEPDYLCQHPFKGIFQLGSSQILFAMDGENPLASGYDTIYLDMNSDGDLTNDDPILIDPAKQISNIVLIPDQDQWKTNVFPTISFPITVDGHQMEYHFIITISMHHLGDQIDQVKAELHSAAYREGTVKLGGNEMRLVLCDGNSNGRFDDVLKILPQEDSSWSGDVILIDPDDSGKSTMDWRFLHKACVHWVGDFICIDGRYYDMNLTPDGERLTLIPADIFLGMVQSPHPNFEAIVHSDTGVFRFRCNPDGKALLPIGKWQLSSYVFGHEGILSNQYFSARGTANTEGFTVMHGRTTTLPYGPPFSPSIKVAKVFPDQDSSGLNVKLEMEFEGKAGELGTGKKELTGKPHIVITDENGTVVAEGKFTIIFTKPYLRITLPAPLQERYKVCVTMSFITTECEVVTPFESWLSKQEILDIQKK